MAKRDKDPRLQELFKANKNVYSISKCNTIEECLYETFKSYIEHDKGTNGIYGVLGTKIHDKLEEIINGEATVDELPDTLNQELLDLDMLGIELGGALKNVIALAAGMADGLGYGDNTKAALITRGITEIGRLALAMGAQYETLSGLTGIGDLIVTCASVHSRNRKAGMLIGQGKTMEEATQEVQMVVEGVYSAKAAIGLSEKYQVPMPIIEQVNQVLFFDKPVAEAVQELMLRDKKAEHEKMWEHKE